MIPKDVTLHRMNLKNEVLELFKQENILQCNLNLTIKDPRGKDEFGIGNGVARDVICSFFSEFLTSYTIGCDEVVPSIRHTMSKVDWEAVGRIILFGNRVGYFPLRVSQAFLVSAIFGEESVDDTLLVTSFKQYLSTEERDCVEKMLQKYEEENEELLLEVLSSYNCYKKPTQENIFEILHELAHQELIQKPRYIAEAFHFIFKKYPSHPFLSKEELLEFYTKRIPSSRKVIKCLHTDNDISEAQRSVVMHLHRYIKSCDKKDLLVFVKFITGGDLMPDGKILVKFTDQAPRAPRSRTCVPQLELQDTYSCCNELSEEFTSVLNNSDSYIFLLLKHYIYVISYPSTLSEFIYA